MQFLLTYCTYDPDNYHGHFLKEFNADNMAAAEEKAVAFIKSLYPQAPVEWRLLQVTDWTSHRLFPEV